MLHKTVPPMPIESLKSQLRATVRQLSAPSQRLRRVYLQATYTGMLSCMAALSGRSDGRAEEVAPCFMPHDRRDPPPPTLTPEGLALTKEAPAP